jgi:hypothetical protein
MAEVDHPVHLDLIARPHTPATEHALIEIPQDHGVGIIDGILRRIDGKAEALYL